MYGGFAPMPLKNKNMTALFEIAASEAPVFERLMILWWQDENNRHYRRLRRR